ncbi:MAG TPA: protein kinase [Candidatus Sulfotelmatobacter sp.]|nr:protein kinase [Candidatus Sulfotelmatobacter sp.]
MPSLVPRRIDKYEVLGVVARGGMGVVYKAVDRTLEREVAIKMVSGSRDERSQGLKRFYREAQFTASLRHPNIVTVYDLGEFQGTPYLVMEYLPGRSLQSLLEEQAMPLLQKVRCIRQVCEGLHYAHTRQPAIIHRDIKPANIMVLEDGMVKIIDFGIARLGQNRNTRTGFVMGTYQYMSPEQVRNQEIDGRSDVFSTGVVLFHLLTHRLPFDGANVSQTLEMIMNAPAPPLSRLLRDYPRQLDAILARALAKRREERYQTADELAFDLAQVEADLKRGSFGRHIAEAERMYQQGNYERAKAEVGRVLEVDSDHREAGELMTRIQRASTLQQRQKRALSLRQQSEEALKLNRVSEAFSCVEQALRLDPDNEELRHLREKILLKEKVNQALSRAERAVAADRFEEALRAVQDALESDPESVRAKSFKLMIEAKLAGRHPLRPATTESFPRSRRTKTTASLKRPTTESKPLSPPAVGAPGRLFEEPDPVWSDDAWLALLKPTAELHGNRASFDGTIHREPVYSASFDLGRDDARAEPVAASKLPRIENRPPLNSFPRSNPAQGQDGEAERQQTRREAEGPARRSQAWSYSALQVLENRLAALIGPLAKMVVRKAALQARNTADLLEIVAASIKQRKDRQAFLEGNAGWPEGAEERAIASPQRPASVPVPTGPGGSLISSADVDRARRLLAEYIGPLAGVLTKKASRQASSVQEFYVLLSEHVKSGVERSRFLRDLGA